MSRAGRSDGDLTKSKILDAAGRLIAQDGFAKPRVKPLPSWPKSIWLPLTITSMVVMAYIVPYLPKHIRIILMNKNS